MTLFRKPQPPIRSLIGEGTRVRGELCFAEGLRIDGEVLGDVVAEPLAGSLLVVSEKARVQGKVMAAHVIINGTIEGPVVASQMLELQPRARVVGDVRYRVLEMHAGATVSGALEPVAAPDKPVLQLAAAKEA